eukprot:m.240671 g.240671  ORF g.240671 m.240671 type:complete len:349 (-) comp15736_c0_seq1:104-1150(-)
MSQFLRVASSQPLRFVEKYLHAEEEARKYRQIEWDAAVCIQSAWRGFKQRRVVKKWINSALMIQKVFRGLKERQKYDYLVKTKLQDKRKRQFDAVATKIQAAWRGYVSRKRVLDFYGRRAYLKEVHAHNEAIKREMEAFEAEQEHIRQQQQAEKKKKKQLRQLERQHHMLSTHAQKGVISRQFGEDAEVTVRAVTRLRSVHKTMQKKLTPKKKHETLASTMKKRPQTQQPAATQQGPFLQPLQLDKIRHKKEKTSLARMNDYEPPRKPEEIFARKDDGNVFKPFANTAELQPKKEPSIFMSSNYIGFGPSDTKETYGRQTFRPEQLRSKDDSRAFATTVKGVTVFDDI